MGPFTFKRFEAWQRLGLAPPPDEALKLRLIDHVGQLHDAQEVLLKRAGDGAAMVRRERRRTKDLTKDKMRSL